MTKRNGFIALLIVAAVMLAGVGLLPAGCNEGDGTTGTTAAAAPTTAAGPTTSVAVAGGEKTLAAGEAWALTETTSLDSLTVGEGATITAPEGKSLTLTVDGVETPIAAGAYSPNVVLTLTDDLIIAQKSAGGGGGGAPAGGAPAGGAPTGDAGAPAGGAPTGDAGAAPAGAAPGGAAPTGDAGAAPAGAAPAGGTAAATTSSGYKYRTAIYIEDGVYVPEKSVAAAVVGGEVTDTSATDISITSVGPLFNGIVAQNSAAGTSPFTYTVENLDLNFTGNGGNDFSGYGSALMTDGYADLTVNNSDFVTNGVVRNVASIKGHSTIRFNGCNLETGNSELPEVTEGMMSVPWVLGLVGTCRATNLMDYGTEYVTDCTIKAQAWGALSTDATTSCRMYVKDSTIEVVESGYGSYSIGDSVNTFDHCTFDVADIALIMANEVSCGVFTNYCEVNSGRFGVMTHAGNVGTITIDKGSVFNCDETVIQVKSSYPEIKCDDATLNSGTGVILQAMLNDDSGSGAGTPRDVNASFSNMTMTGDMVNSMTTLANVNVKLTNATLTGAITTATVVSEASLQGIDLTAFGPFTNEGAQYHQYIGWVHNTYAATSDPYGITATLDATSTWTVDETSYLTGLTIADGAAVTAPAGKTLTMKVDGVETPIAAGSYAGKIELAVN
jgi:hypothetical protein